MRLAILDHGHRLRTKAVLAMIRLVSGHAAVDVVKLAFYRPDFYGGGALTDAAMRGLSAWSVGERELMAAYISAVNDCPFCVAAHTATADLCYRDATAATTLADLRAAPITEPLRATLGLLGKLTREHRIDADDVRAVLATGVTTEQVADALAVGLVFNITDRLANAFDFEVAAPAAMAAGARHLVKRGYR